MSYAAKEISVYQGQPVECYRFARGGTIWRYTSADKPVTVNGETYAPEVIQRDAVDQSQEDTAGSLTITVPRDNEVAALFVAYLPVQPVELKIYRVHRGEAEVVPAFIGKVVATSFQGSEAKLTASPVTEVLRRTVPTPVYQAPCNHALYGPGCGVNKGDFLIQATISASADGGATLDSSGLVGILTTDPTYFDGGFVARSDGEIRFIAAAVIVGGVGRVFLVNPFQGVVVGVELDFYPGCNRSEDACENKFNNLVNHLGFARIPTKNPFNTDLSGTGGAGAGGGDSNISDLIHDRFFGGT